MCPFQQLEGQGLERIFFAEKPLPFCCASGLLLRELEQADARAGFDPDQ
jgi:hypothetical protein